MFDDKLIIIRGAGDIATGTINRLFKCHFKVLCLEVEKPSAIRRTVSYSEAIYNGSITVENTTAVKVNSVCEMNTAHKNNLIPIMIDSNCNILKTLKPDVLVDAIIAKKNLGTNMDMAKLTIALGPGFEAGVDVNYVIETMRGHSLGKVISKGFALKNTGIPGLIAGKSKERVIHSPKRGIIKNIRNIGDIVKQDDIIAYIDDTKIYAGINGILRGIIKDGYEVYERMKIADVDPRLDEYENCFTISDKAKAISGGVLEAMLMHGF